MSRLRALVLAALLAPLGQGLWQGGSYLLVRIEDGALLIVEDALREAGRLADPTWLERPSTECVALELDEWPPAFKVGQDCIQALPPHILRSYDLL